MSQKILYLEPIISGIYNARLLRRTIACATLAALLSGCGTMVPSLQEVGDETLLVQSIVTSIRCEVANAARRVIDADRDARTQKLGPVGFQLLTNWGAEVAITLAFDDKTTVSPNAVGMPPSPAGAVFSIAGNLSASSQATRTGKVNYFYTLKELYATPCATGLQPESGAPSPIIRSDLKTADWLYSTLMLPIYTGEAHLETSSKGILQQNVLSHEVKFVLGTSGGLNPAFTLTRATVNQSGTFLSTSRDRTSDLIVTFGPLDPGQRNGALIPQAELVHQSSQIGLANSINGQATNFNFSLFH